MTMLRGIAYPMRLSGGSLAVSIDEALVRDAIMSVLSTRPLEYLTRPTYGTPEQIFDATPEELINEFRQRLVNQVSSDYPDVEFILEGLTSEDGSTSVNIIYEIGGLPQPILTLRLR